MAMAKIDDNWTQETLKVIRLPTNSGGLYTIKKRMRNTPAIHVATHEIRKSELEETQMLHATAAETNKSSDADSQKE